ncbi:hypothetical protein BFJ71_g5091 [Fusarium oxysporum]|nr:hypothetical protein BFJ71_g5091 [Fusarium oxysporum]
MVTWNRSALKIIFSENCSCPTRFLFNSSVSVYDPYKRRIVDNFTFLNIALNPNHHVAGIAVDPSTGLLGVTVNDRIVLQTLGKEAPSLSYFLLYDQKKRQVKNSFNINAVTKGKVIGIQDLDYDKRGHKYVLGSYPSSIVRIDPSGRRSTAWYMAEPFAETHLKYGFGGIQIIGDVVLVNDNMIGGFKRFDARSSIGSPTVVPFTPNVSIEWSDAIFAPPRYHGTVLLVAENYKGISVMRSHDGWKTADYMGLITASEVDIPSDALTVATVQIGQSLYAVPEFFFDAPVAPWNAGNRTQYTLYDITAKVETLLC